MRLDFESKPFYGDDDKYIKTKRKTYADSIITNFHNKKMTKEKAPCNVQILLLNQMKSIIFKHFQKNANMYK